MCTVECAAILVVLDFAYHLSSEYRNCRLSYRCTIIKSTLHSTNILIYYIALPDSLVCQKTTYFNSDFQSIPSNVLNCIYETARTYLN